MKETIDTINARIDELAGLELAIMTKIEGANIYTAIMQKEITERTYQLQAEGQKIK